MQSLKVESSFENFSLGEINDFIFGDEPELLIGKSLFLKAKEEPRYRPPGLISRGFFTVPCETYGLDQFFEEEKLGECRVSAKLPSQLLRWLAVSVFRKREINTNLMLISVAGERDIEALDRGGIWNNEFDREFLERLEIKFPLEDDSSQV